VKNKISWRKNYPKKKLRKLGKLLLAINKINKQQEKNSTRAFYCKTFEFQD